MNQGTGLGEGNVLMSDSCLRRCSPQCTLFLHTAKSPPEAVWVQFLYLRGANFAHSDATNSLPEARIRAEQVRCFSFFFFWRSTSSSAEYLKENADF